MQVCKSPHIVRIWIGGMYRVRQDMNMGVDLFQRLPVCNSRSNPSRVPICRFSAFFGSILLENVSRAVDHFRTRTFFVIAVGARLRRLGFEIRVEAQQLTADE